MNSDRYFINVFDNATLSKNGMLGLTFMLDNAEPYSLSHNDLIERNNQFVKALNLLPENSYYQRSDYVFTNKVDSSIYFPYQNYINQSEYKYFNNRTKPYHFTTISFFIDDIKTLQKPYLANPFKIKKNLIDSEKKRIQEFESSVNNIVGILKNLKTTAIYPISEQDLKELTFKKINGFNTSNHVQTALYDKDISIGDNYFKVYSFSEANHFSEQHNTIENDDTIPKSEHVFRGFFDVFGIYFPFNHIYNQIIKIPNQKEYKNILDNRKIQYDGWKDYSADIKKTYKYLCAYEESISQEDNKICFSHNNICLFSPNQKNLLKAAKSIKQIFSKKTLTPVDCRAEYAHNVFESSTIGRANQLDSSFFFMSSLKDALPLMPHYSTFKDHEQGMVFQDRLYRTPLIQDIFDKNKIHIAAKNGMLITPTGEGKSSTMLNLLYQMMLLNTKLICIEFGESFKFLTEIFKERAVQIKLKPNSPLGINPFELNSQEPTTDKIVSVTGFILKLWRKNAEMIQNEAPFFVTLQKLVKDYYDNYLGEHNMKSFYDYMFSNWQEIIERQNIKEKFFDVDEFELILSQFVKGGIYENVFKKNNSVSKLVDADLIVYEMTAIKKDPFLLSIVLTSLEDTINNIILSDRSQFGGVIFEEFGETSELKDIFGGGDVLSSVAWMYQKIRKENGFVWTVLQTISQLPDNQYTKNIIANTQILLTLGLSNTVADAIIDAFKIRNNQHIALMKSTQKQFDSNPKWSELFVRWGESHATVVRQEFPTEKYLSFQTEGVEWDFMNLDLEKTKDITKTVINAQNKFNYENKFYDNVTLFND